MEKRLLRLVFRLLCVLWTLVTAVACTAFDRADDHAHTKVSDAPQNRHHSIGVVSLQSDSAGLFDYHDGILVAGVDFDSDHPETTGNYYRRGRAAERTAHFEFIDGEDVIEQDCGLRAHGNISRRQEQKGLSLYARNEYGKKNFKGIFGPESKDKRLVLRPFCSAWTSAGIQNLFCQWLAEEAGCHFDVLKCRPVVLYLNGDYRGIYFLEQKPDEKLIAKRHGYDPDSVRLVRDWAGHTDNGFDSGFVAMMQWLKTADLSDNQQYERVAKQVDIASFIDYVLFETFIGNRDWPANNMRCWSAEGSPWRFIFYDADAVRTTKFNAVENALYDGTDKTWPTSSEATLLMRKLLGNSGFRNQFRKRMYDLYSGPLCWRGRNDKGFATLFGIAWTDMKSEIAAQSVRFGSPKSLRAWKRDVRRLKRYFKRRARQVEREWGRVL